MKTPKTGENIKICESCGKNFPCGAQINECWCFKVEIPPEDLAQLEKQFKYCLCPQCLESFSVHAETADTPK